MKRPKKEYFELAGKNYQDDYCTERYEEHLNKYIDHLESKLTKYYEHTVIIDIKSYDIIIKSRDKAQSENKELIEENKQIKTTIGAYYPHIVDGLNNRL